MVLRIGGGCVAGVEGVDSHVVTVWSHVDGVLCVVGVLGVMWCGWGVFGVTRVRGALVGWLVGLVCLV